MEEGISTYIQQLYQYSWEGKRAGGGGAPGKLFPCTTSRDEVLSEAIISPPLTYIGRYIVKYLD